MEDNNFITITNFTDSNNTHYDFYWYATWIDGDGESQMFEEKWLNRELNPWFAQNDVVYVWVILRNILN